MQWLAVMVVVACAAGIITSAHSSAAKNAPSVGINSFDPFANPSGFDEECGWFISQISELGIGSVRVRFPWNMIEPERGKYDWSLLDKLVDSYIQAGLHVHGVLSGPSAWSQDGVAPASEDERKAFAQFAGEATARYKTTIPSWEVWHTPNLATSWAPKPDPFSYSETLREAHAAILSSHTDSIVVAPSVANCDTSFLEDLYSHGVGDLFEVLSSQVQVPVGQDSPLRDCFDQLQRAMLNHERASKRVWITDLTISQPSEPAENVQLMEVSHASSLVKRFVESFSEASVEKVFLSRLVDGSTTGQLVGLGLLRQDRSPRAAFVACKTLIEHVANRQFQGEVYLSPSIKAYFFPGSREDSVLALWSLSGRRKVLVPASTSQVRVTDIRGEKVWKFCDNGVAEIEVDTSPLFVETDSSLLRLNASFFFQEPTITLAMNAPGTNSLTILNFLSEGISGSIRFKTPQGWSSDPSGTAVRLNPYQRETLTASFKPPRDCPPGAYDIEAALTLSRLNGERSREILTGFRAFVVEPAEVSLSPKTSNEGLEVSLRLRNSGPTPLSGSLSLVFLAPLSQNPFREGVNELSPNFGMTSIFQIEPAVLVSTPITEIRGQFVSNAGDTKGSAPLKISRQPLVTTQPVIDGKLKDWNWAAPITLGAEDQILRQDETPRPLSIRTGAEVQVCWTDSSMLIAAQVRDRVPLVNDATGEYTASGDSLEIFLGFRGHEDETEPSGDKYHLVLGTGRAGKNPNVYEMTRRRPVRGAEIRARKVRGGYSLEAAIPLSEIGDFVPAHGELFSFDILLNDRNDYKDDAPHTTLAWARRPAQTAGQSNWGWGLIIPQGEQ